MATDRWTAELPAELPVHEREIVISEADGYGTTVAVVHSFLLAPAEVNRRALLLAAAPELLAVVQKLYASVVGHEIRRPGCGICELLALAEAALTKALGKEASRG